MGNAIQELRESLEGLNEEVTKTKSAKKVLQLMDKDVEFADAVKKVSKEDGISREKLEKELEPWI